MIAFVGLVVAIVLERRAQLVDEDEDFEWWLLGVDGQVDVSLVVMIVK